MTGSSKAKGDRYERELAKILGVERQLGAGRKLDVGDIHWNGWAIQVAYRATPESLAKAAAKKWPEVCAQAERSGNRPALALRLPRRPWWILTAGPLAVTVRSVLELVRSESYDGSVHVFRGGHLLRVDSLDGWMRWAA